MNKQAVIQRIICNLTQVNQIDNNANLIESGILDSFQIANLIAELEKEFGIRIPGDDVSAENFGRVSSIVALVKRLGK